MNRKNWELLVVKSVPQQLLIYGSFARVINARCPLISFNEIISDMSLISDVDLWCTSPYNFIPISSQPVNCDNWYASYGWVKMGSALRYAIPPTFLFTQSIMKKFNLSANQKYKLNVPLIVTVPIIVIITSKN